MKTRAHTVITALKYYIKVYFKINGSCFMVIISELSVEETVFMKTIL